MSSRVSNDSPKEEIQSQKSRGKKIAFNPFEENIKKMLKEQEQNRFKDQKLHQRLSTTRNSQHRLSVAAVSTPGSAKASEAKNFDKAAVGPDQQQQQVTTDETYLKVPKITKHQRANTMQNTACLEPMIGFPDNNTESCEDNDQQRTSAVTPV